MSDQIELLQQIVERLKESLSSKFITDEVRQKLEVTLASIQKDLDSRSEARKHAASA
jgi:hypothetical protein